MICKAGYNFVKIIVRISKTGNNSQNNHVRNEPENTALELVVNSSQETGNYYSHTVIILHTSACVLRHAHDIRFPYPNNHFIINRDFAQEKQLTATDIAIK